MPSPFVHFELNMPDTAKAKKFYGQLFGWQFTDMDMGDGMIYSTFKTDSGPGGGMMSVAHANPGWLNYVGVDNVDTATEKAKSLGGQVHVAPQDIPNVGRFSIIADPGGSVIALFHPKTS